MAKKKRSKLQPNLIYNPSKVFSLMQPHQKDEATSPGQRYFNPNSTFQNPGGYKPGQPSPGNSLNPIGKQPGIFGSQGILGMTQELHRQSLNKIVRGERRTGRARAKRNKKTDTTTTTRKFTHKPRGSGANLGQPNASGGAGKPAGSPRGRGAQNASNQTKYVEDPISAAVRSILNEQLAATNATEKQYRGINSELGKEYDAAKSTTEGVGASILNRLGNQVTTDEAQSKASEDYVRSVLGSDFGGSGNADIAAAGNTVDAQRAGDRAYDTSFAGNTTAANSGFFEKMKAAQSVGLSENLNKLVGERARIKNQAPFLKMQFQQAEAESSAKQAAADLMRQRLGLQAQGQAFNQQMAGLKFGEDVRQFDTSQSNQNARFGLGQQAKQNAALQKRIDSTLSGLFKMNKDGGMIAPNQPFRTTIKALTSIGIAPGRAARIAANKVSTLPGNPSFKPRRERGAYSAMIGLGVRPEVALSIIRQQYGNPSWQPGLSSGAFDAANNLVNAARGRG